jgi:hypothetical protein
VHRVQVPLAHGPEALQAVSSTGRAAAARLSDPPRPAASSLVVTRRRRAPRSSSKRACAVALQPLPAASHMYHHDRTMLVSHPEWRGRAGGQRGALRCMRRTRGSGHGSQSQSRCMVPAPGRAPVAVTP